MKVGVVGGENLLIKREHLLREAAALYSGAVKADVHLCVLIILTVAMNQLFPKRNFWSVPAFYQE